jgi:hypothetical protein
VDLDRFASLLRSVSQTPSRREALRALAGACLGGRFGVATPTAHAADEAARKRNRTDPCQGHDDDTPCGIGKRCCGDRCVDVLGSADHCGHCGNACGDTTMTCVGGSCCQAGIRCVCTARGGACGPPPPDWTGPPPCCNVGACTGGVCPCA